ncbi:MAG: hypothetical protein MOGMAGMI_01437 [Candidatus Omnitrophica bacterium]|nr:hypothetical protein [Candidatus Omnitrophota bacterium]
MMSAMTGAEVREIDLHLQGFEGRGLKVRPAGFWNGPQVLIDGVPIKPVKGKYTIKNNYGQDIDVRWKPGLLMLDPVLVVAGEAVRFARPMRIAEKIWVLLPLVLLAVGGAIGGALGAGAVWINASIMRSPESAPLRYVATGLVTLAAAGLWLALAVLVHGTVTATTAS